MKGVNDALTIVIGLSDMLDEDNDFDLIHTQELIRLYLLICTAGSVAENGPRCLSHR